MKQNSQQKLMIKRGKSMSEENSAFTCGKKFFVNLFFSNDLLPSSHFIIDTILTTMKEDLSLTVSILGSLYFCIDLKETEYVGNITDKLYEILKKKLSMYKISKLTIRGLYGKVSKDSFDSYFEIQLLNGWQYN